MKVKIIDYAHRSAMVDIPDGTKCIRVEVISGDEIFTYADENGIIQTIDAADIFGTRRSVGYPDGFYSIMIGSPEWEQWINRQNDSYYWLSKIIEEELNALKEVEEAGDE